MDYIRSNWFHKEGVNKLNIKLKPFKKYKNIFYYIFHYSLYISLIPAILGLIILPFSVIISVTLILIVFIYDMIIFELIEHYLWKRAKKKILEKGGRI